MVSIDPILDRDRSASCTTHRGKRTPLTPIPGRSVYNKVVRELWRSNAEVDVRCLLPFFLHHRTIHAGDLEMWRIRDVKTGRARNDVEFQIVTAGRHQASFSESYNLLVNHVDVVQDQCLEVALSGR